MTLVTTTSTYISNLPLTNSTYRLITKARTFESSQYPHHWLFTHAMTTRFRASQIAFTIAQVVVEGILLMPLSDDYNTSQ
jgi:hypothetical protein